MDRREHLKQRLKEQANETFPAAARAGGYPIRFNHCFLRVVYDNLLGAQWQKVLKKGKPAIHQLSEEQLTKALTIGEEVIASKDRCAELNQKSLRYRGKLKD